MTTFRDIEVFDFRPDHKSPEAGQLDDFAFDSTGFGVATPWRESGANRRQLSLALLLRDRAEIGDVRRFVDRHRARQLPFWLPAYVNEFDLLEDASATDTEITVAGHNFSSLFAVGGQHKFIVLLTRSGKLECYGVTSVASGGSDDVLALSRGLDTDLDASATVCSPLLLARLADDELELDYIGGETARAELSFVELPREYPGTAEVDSAEDSAHFGTRPVFLYRITDGVTTLRLADYGVDLTAASLAWTAADITGGDLVSTLDLLGDTMSVTLKTNDTAHPLRDYLDPLNARNFSIELFLADMADLAGLDLNAPDHVGRIEEVSFSPGGRIEVEVSSLFRLNEMRLPKLQLQRLANSSVYDFANEATFTTAGTISALSEDPAYVEATAFGAKATAESDPNWFALGKVIAGDEVRLCVGADGNRLYLNYPFRRAAVTDSVSARAGDDKRIATWNDKFSQLANYDGFPYIPARNPQFKALETPKQTGGKK